MSRRVRYHVAVSLDGFIAGPNGEYDWIVMDPSIDFAALYKEFDTVVMGRKTYEVTTATGGHGAMPGLDVVVFSRTLPAATYPGVRILNDNPRQVVAALKAKRGGDIWLFGGGNLFRSLLDAGLVDTVEVAVMPVLIGAGIPLLPPGAATKLVLADQKILPASGIVALAYSVSGSVGPAPRIRYIKSAKSRKKKTARSRSKKDHRTGGAPKRRAAKKLARVARENYDWSSVAKIFMRAIDGLEAQA
ncbi:MAG TPA: dihydrofolate reductase family protein [Gemmatimonadaceae bacterium]